MIDTRTYGTEGPYVVVLHGGPGAPGHMEPVARSLASIFRVVEPFQRRGGGEPLTVDGHLRDLHEVVDSLDSAEPVRLVGSSWGAMLALAYAAAQPERVAGTVLVGCGTFEPMARAHLNEAIEARTDDALKAKLERVDRDIEDPDLRLAKRARLLFPLYTHDPIRPSLENEWIDARGHRESWQDMLRLQEEGRYPHAFRSVTAPVLMLHGSEDPHPGRMIRDSLLPYVPHLEYREWKRCGHYPWLERAVRKEFFACLTRWLSRLTPESSTPAAVE